jgi:hypothetical protein
MSSSQFGQYRKNLLKKERKEGREGDRGRGRGEGERKVNIQIVSVKITNFTIYFQSLKSNQSLVFIVCVCTRAHALT